MHQLPENILTGIRTWVNGKVENLAGVAIMTQADYNALVAAGNVDELTLYVIYNDAV